MDHSRILAAASTALATLGTHASTLSDAQLQRYGWYLVAAAGACYLATSLQVVVPADCKYAVEAHLPQGYDRSVIGARLEARHTRALLLSCLELQRLKDDLRTETTREGKLRGWEKVFRRTLVSLLAACHTHSLTLSLFAMKNTVRVLVFVLHRREAAVEAWRRKKEHQKKKRKQQGHGNNATGDDGGDDIFMDGFDGGSSSGGGGRGPLAKLKAWWTGGTQTVILETLMERMNDQLDKQASPFANTGLDDDDDTTTTVDGAAAAAQPFITAATSSASTPGGGGAAAALPQSLALDGREAFMYSRAASQEAAYDDDDSSDDDDDGGAAEQGDGENRGLGACSNANDDDNEGDGASMVGSNRASSTATTTTGRGHRNRTSAAMAEADRLFSIQEIMSGAVSAIVATATAVVDRVLASYPAGAFSIAGSVSSNDLRGLMARLCAEMARSACIAEWLHPSVRPRASRGPINENSNAAPPSGRPRNDSRGFDSDKYEDSDDDDDANGDGDAFGNGLKRAGSSGATATPASNGTAAAAVGNGGGGYNDDDSDGDIVHFPAGWTAMLGPDGRPIPRHSTTGGGGGGAVTDAEYMDGIFHPERRRHNTTTSSSIDTNPLFDGLLLPPSLSSASSPSSLSPAARRLHRREAARAALRLKQQTTGYFQELIHSSSFAELCLQHSENLLLRTMRLAADLSLVRGYDASADSAKVLLVVAGLEAHRQRLFDATECEVPASVKLFCEETVRATCSQV